MVIIGLSACGLVFILISILNDHTGFTGDSMVHYLFSRYAFHYPEHFFDHWAKPVFVLFSAPFSQLGFSGIKIFNSLVAVFTGYFVYRSARLLKERNAWMAPLLLFLSPLYLSLIFSGLTEYLFGLFMIIAVYLFLKGKNFILPVILFSFLPFIRAEGLISLIIAGLFLALNRRWTLIPLLMTGHLLYSIAGYFIHGDPLWVFHHNPYAQLASPYGAGGPFDFFTKMLNVSGIPVYILIVAGFIAWIVRHRVHGIKKYARRPEEHLLYLHFIAFFAAHSLFWWLGIFNSMGLSRVMIAVVPLTALIALHGLNSLLDLAGKMHPVIPKWIFTIFLFYLVIFPFTGNPYALGDNSFDGGMEQKIFDQEVIPVVLQYESSHLMYYDHPYISVAAGIDHFDRSARRPTRFIRQENEVARPALVIFDNWYSRQEGWTGEIPPAKAGDPRLVMEIKRQDTQGRNYHVTLFEYNKQPKE